MKMRVVAALISSPLDERRFLVQQRLPTKARPLLWEFPGGKVEPGETDEVALRRECLEELDVELSILGLFGTNEFSYPETTVELLLYRAQIIRGEPKPLMAEAIRFLTPSEMLELEFCPADIPVLHQLNAQLGSE